MRSQKYELRRKAKPGPASRHRALALRNAGFTLIELILVMTLIVVVASLVTPRLGVFFRGRTLDSEARQVMALMHQGQSKAVSGGVPTVLWFDTTARQYGLEEEPGYVDKDPNAVSFDLNENLKVEIPDDDPSTSVSTDASSNDPHAGQPHITFLPDGTIAEASPQTIRIVDNDGPVLSLTQTRDHNDYEIATTTTEQ
jgi:type II secretion system protein H